MTMKSLRYNEWSMQNEILRRVRQEDEVRHARIPHHPPKISNPTIPQSGIWRDPARFVFLRQMLP